VAGASTAPAVNWLLVLLPQPQIFCSW